MPGASVRAATRSKLLPLADDRLLPRPSSRTSPSTVHLIPFLIARGYGAGFAATAAGLVGIMALPGRLIFTPLGGIWPRRYVTAAIFVLQAIALVVLLTVRSEVGVFAFVALFGAGFGAITPARASLVAELYGARHYGSIAGILAFFVTGARGAGPGLGGLPLHRRRAATSRSSGRSPPSPSWRPSAILPIERGVPAQEGVGA